MENDVASLMMSCVVLHSGAEAGLITDRKSTIVAAVESELKAYLTDQAEGLSSSSFKPLTGQPGYLQYDNSEMPVLFPWIIVDSLPPKGVLDELIDICMQIKIGKYSTVCLSGSSLYFGSIQSISDIDILEYKNSIDEQPIPHPEGFLVLKQNKDYVEYIAKSGFWGMVEISNTIVPYNYQKSGDEASPSSFAYQESPMIYTPRELFDPFALGRYLAFLARSSLLYLSKTPEKSAKRLLPLSRLIMKPHIGTTIEQAFAKAEVQSALRVREKLRLWEKLDEHDAKQEPIRQDLAREVSSIRGKETDMKLSKAEQQSLDDLAVAMRTLCRLNMDLLNRLQTVGVGE